MLLPNSGIETHPAGTGSLNAIVNGNWNAIDAWANPAYGFTAARAGTTVTAQGGPAADGKIFTSDNIGDKILFANGTAATITATAGTPGAPSATCTVGSSGTVAQQAFNLYAAVTESPYTLFARAFTKLTRKALIPNGYTLIWSAAQQKFVASPLVATEPSTFLNTATAIISNSAAEASILGRASAATIPGNSVAAGTMLEFYLHGTIKTTGATPSLQLRVKLGGTIYVEVTDPTLPQFIDYDFQIKGFLKLTGALGAMTVRGQALCTISMPNTAGSVRPITIVAVNTGTTIDMTADRAFDVTAKFGTANANNVLTIYSSRMKQYTNPN